jgi:hypothetical protein
MKKIVVIALVVLFGWLGFSYVSAAWTRERFTDEVDSFLQSPRDLSESMLIPLILNKARQYGMELRPEDIRMTITSSDRETTTSKLLENKGLKTDVRTLSLHVQYEQSFLGSSRLYTLDRERTFTAQISPSAEPPTGLTDPLPP